MAQTLKFGNKVWAAKEESVLAYNDINNNYKPLPFFFKRTSIGTRVNKDGLIETMGQDIARIDYSDSADGVLLLEPVSTNLITYSEDFSQWSAINNVVVTDNFTTSPDGTQNASKFTFDGTSISRVEKTVTVVSGTKYTFSVWLKNDDLANPTQVWIGLNITTQGEYVTVTNEWKRFTTTQVSNGTAEYPRIQTNEVGSIFSWGAQLEQLSYPTSYIPTSGSTVTRAAEVCNNSGNSEVFNDSEGVLFADIRKQENGGSTQVISLSDGSTNNNVYLSLPSTPNVINVEVLASGSQANLSSASTNQSNQNKFAIKYKQNDFVLWINGFEVDTDNSGNTPVGLNKINFDFGQGSFDFYGKTKEIGYYDTALTDLELETLTSYRNWVSMVNELNLNIIYNG